MADGKQNSFHQWMAQLRSGDDDAATHVFRRFADRLIRLAQTRIGDRLKSKVDPADIVQSVYRSFFVRNMHGGYEDYQLDDWESLWSLLALITVGKCAKKARGLRTQKRNVGREESLDGEEHWEIIGREPSPEAGVMMGELVEELFSVVGEQNQEILVLALQQHRTEEIAEKLGVTQRRVQRVLQRVSRHLTDAEE